VIVRKYEKNTDFASAETFLACLPANKDQCQNFVTKLGAERDSVASERGEGIKEANAKAWGWQSEGGRCCNSPNYRPTITSTQTDDSGSSLRTIGRKKKGLQAAAKKNATS